MKFPTRPRIDLSLLALAVTCSFSTAQGGQPVQTNVSSKIYYEHYLHEIGDRLDCYFTVERLAPTRNTRSAFSFLDVVFKDVATVDELVQHLRAQMKGIDIVLRKAETAKPAPGAKRIEAEPIVIHLIETPLARRHDYPLERKIDLEFSGTTGELINRLKEKLGNIGPWRAGGIPMVYDDDRDTQVTVDAKKRTVREVLTDAVLRRSYNRILWDAHLHEEGGSVEVRFNGGASDEQQEE